MSVTRALEKCSNSKFVVPCAGKMFKSSISKKDKALCFVLNKGYIETDNLEDMLLILDSLSSNKDFIFVGGVEKVGVNNLKVIYRQRLFFKSLLDLLSSCKELGMYFELLDDFRITINNVLNCIHDLRYLERYAFALDEDIDTYLTNACIINLHHILIAKGMRSNLGVKVENILENKSGYMDRAPLIISRYNIDKFTSAVYCNNDYRDIRLYSPNEATYNKLKYGFTDSNVKYDKKRGKFK